jgi:hypothetical protein
MLNTLKIEDFQQRFNSLYGVQNFYRYLTEENWINNKKIIENLVGDIEEFLSKNLLSYRFFIRQMHFLYPVNLFHILAFSNFSLGRYNETLKCLDFLIRLDDKPSFYSTYFNILLNPGYNPVLFSAYARLIRKGLKNGNPPCFTYSSNPFKPKGVIPDSETFFHDMLTNLNNSFF